MQRYLFFTISGGYTPSGTQWADTASKGRKLYYISHWQAVSDRNQAGLFTDEDWDNWGKQVGAEREDASGYEEMRRSGAPMLPGMEG